MGVSYHMQCRVGLVAAAADPVIIVLLALLASHRIHQHQCEHRGGSLATGMEASHLEQLRKRRVVDRYHERLNSRKGRPLHKNTSLDPSKVSERN